MKKLSVFIMRVVLSAGALSHVLIKPATENAAAVAKLNAEKKALGERLFSAAKNNDLSAVRLLIAEGAPIDFQDQHGWTALMQAAWRGHTNVVRILLENKASVDVQNNDGWTALIWAADQPHAPIVDVLLENNASTDIQNEHGDTALMRAAEKGHTNIVRILLTNNASVDARDKRNSSSALMRAAARGHTDTVRALLEHNASVNVNIQNTDGWTALMRAAHWGRTDAMCILLENNASVHMQNNAGNTALMLSPQLELMLLRRPQFIKTVEMLIVAGADLSVRNNIGETFFTKAQKNPLFVLGTILEDAIAERDRIRALKHQAVRAHVEDISPVADLIVGYEYPQEASE